MPAEKPTYVHMEYIPASGWVLSIMSRLLSSNSSQMREAFDRWSETPLRELGFAITTRMHILARCILRLNASVARLREEFNSDFPQVEACLAEGYAFHPRDGELPYELLLDMDSFIFESRSLYEIVGKFLVALFAALFDRKITESELREILAAKGIDTRWISELRESRKLFFHETAPWIAVKVQQDGMKVEPVLLKRHMTTFEDPNDLIDFSALREIYEGFVASLTALHQFVMEQIRQHESEADQEP